MFGCIGRHVGVHVDAQADAVSLRSRYCCCWKMAGFSNYKLGKIVEFNLDAVAKKLEYVAQKHPSSFFLA